MNKPVVIDYQDIRPLRKVYFELGYGLLQKKSFRLAIQNFQESLEENGEIPHNWEIYFLQGQAFKGLNDHLRAFRSYLQASVSSPWKSAAILPFAHELLTRKIAETDLSWLSHELQLLIEHPEIDQEGKVEIFFFLGRIYLYADNLSQSKHFFQLAKQFRPQDPRILEGLGECLCQEGKLDEALELLKNALSIAGQGPYSERIPGISIRYVRILLEKGMYQESLKIIDTILNEGGGNEEELKLMRGYCYLYLGRAADALAEAERFNSGTGTSSQAYLLRIQAQIVLHQYKEAVSSVNQALTNDPSNPELLFYKIQALIEGQIDLEQAERLLKLYLEDKNGIEALNDLSGRFNLAHRHNDGNVHYFLGQIYFMLNPQWTLDQALEEVEQALELGLACEITYPQVGAWELKGEILLRKNQREEAAKAFYEAGRYHYWDKNYNQARVLFGRSINYMPEHVMTYWYLSDLLLVQSYISNPPYVDINLIIESLKIWENGASIALPGKDDSWAYSVRARISERIGRLPGEDINKCIWEGVYFLERGILLGENDYYRWATLSTLYRTIGYNLCAIHAANTAEKLNPDNLLVIEEKAANLINLGLLQDGVEVLEKLQLQSPSPFYDGWEALILYYHKKYEQATELLNSCIKAYPEDLWYRRVRAGCFRMNDQLPLAFEDCEWIMEKAVKPEYTNDKIDLAWAANLLMNYDKALEVYADALRDEDDKNKYFIHILISLSYFAKGEIQKAFEYFETGIKGEISKLQIQEIKNDLSYFEKTLQNSYWPHSKHIKDILNKTGGIKERIEARELEIYGQETTALDELQEITVRDGKIEVGSSRWLAIHAGLARLYLENKQWWNAFNEYKSLQMYSPEMPEIVNGLSKATSTFIGEGRGLVQRGEFTDAIVAFSTVIDHDLFSVENLATIFSLIGVSQIGLDDTTGAYESFNKALQLFKAANFNNPGKKLGFACSQGVSGIHHYWALDEAFADQSDLHENTNPTHGDFAIAREMLRDYLSTYFDLSKNSSQSANMLPVVTPIVIEIGKALIFSGPDAEWPLIKTYLPEMRDRIRNATGILMPSVRIRGNETELSHNSYIIMLDEIPLVSGTIETDRGFCPMAAKDLSSTGIPDSEIIESYNPETGGKGCWVGPEHWDTLASKNYPLWSDPVIYMVYHLEDVLSQNLDMFLGIQEVENLLELWKATPEGASLVNETLSDSASRHKFSRVLRELVKEQVSVNPGDEIFGAFKGVELTKMDFNEVIRIVRVKLKKYLQGNGTAMNRIHLTSQIENRIYPWIQEFNNSKFFAIPPEETQNLLSDIRQLVNSSNEPTVLVVQNSELRPYVRRLVELEFPNMVVISREELLPHESMHELVDHNLLKS